VSDTTITPERFHGFDWRIVQDAACARFRTASLAEGISLAGAIVGLAGDAGPQPHIDIRPDGVTVRLRMDAEGQLSEQDVSLAEQISSAAREGGAAAHPASLQNIQVAIDALVISDVLPFWQAVLGYRQVGPEDLADPDFRGPQFWFQQMDAARPQRNRIHIDLYVPADQAEGRVAAALAAGGTVVRDRSPDWWTLADPEGNEVDVAPWPDLG
jgi:4a-hydroxytetrahydrobiopterin dehydratase